MAEYGKRPYRHVSAEQMKLMLDFVAQHPDIAKGQCKTSEGRHDAKLRWCQITKTLNHQPGTKKTPVGWSKYWSDYKYKLKKDVVERNTAAPGSKEFRPLYKLEKQALAILGPDFGVQQLIQTNEWIDASSDPLPIPTEVKQESILESTLSNGHSRVINEQGIESDSESSDEECLENEDEKLEEPLEMSNIYPKWLMEIEQKRADAELRRAKAEEQQVEVASKAAEASLIQAEALRKLSEAVEKQADAMLRIAVVFENRSGDVINTSSNLRYH